eukprot:TRINITY_DN92329_c0_g1_i1.p1 TRINITY_DN92329_c0_g1~~TRINITY_DN92329_c0_g1_i1.p1  ORF type:complete len:573 (+),score=99.61 TRINITY_DN92329_c0_g1_i1:77-1720(+)
MVLQSLQATLDKLGADENRHGELVKTIRARMQLSERVTRREHRKMTFARSNYVYMHLLGEGRFGMVKLAKKKSNARVKRTSISPRKSSIRGSQSEDMEFVAVRIIMRKRATGGKWGQDEVLSTSESHAALMKNVEALKMLDHPGICRQIETFEEGQFIYIVMEWYSGDSLLENLTDPLPEEQAASCINQVTSAMAYAHEHNVVHQDLRPENIRYKTADPDARLVICDWSCTEFIDCPPDQSRRNIILSQYSAPELEPSHRSDRADMWSIGVMAYVLLAHQFPFRGAIHDFLPELPHLPKGVHLSQNCLNFIAALLRVDPRQRLSGRQALAHPWLMEVQAIDRQRLEKHQIPDAVKTNLVKFGTLQTVQRAAATFIASHLSGEQLYQLTLAFQKADKNGDGTLDKEEVAELLRDQLAASEGSAEDKMLQMEGIFAAMDSDGSGQVSYSEFLAAASDSIINHNVHLCWEAFHAFDKDGSGRLSTGEIKELIQTDEMRAAVTNATSAMQRDAVNGALKEQFAVLDKNADGAVDFDEFMQILMGQGADATQ